jgi:hypothetical protein
MKTHRVWIALGVMVLAFPGRSRAVSPPALDPGKALGALGGGKSPEALAGSLRAFLVTALPDPLLEDKSKWGKQKTWHGKPRNHGRWILIRARARNARDTLVLDLRDFQKVQPGRSTFCVFLAFDTDVEIDRQTWRHGVRLYSGSTRARLRFKVGLRCEATTRVEATGGLLPDAVFRLRVLAADVTYDNLVVEHTAGVGGDAAKVIGDIVLGALRAFKPSLERNLLDKANAAIVKAGDTKEVRIGLTSLFGDKK